MRKNTKRRLATKPILKMKVKSKEQLKQTVPGDCCGPCSVYCCRTSSSDSPSLSASLLRGVQVQSHYCALSVTRSIAGDFEYTAPSRMLDLCIVGTYT